MADLPMGPWDVIYADPPWQYEQSHGRSRRVENHYETMTLADIEALPVADVAAKDAVLFLWTTAPKMEEGLRVLNAWGFRYRTMGVWAKVRLGSGYWFRQNAEFLLVGTRGEVRAPKEGRQPDSPFTIPKATKKYEHSAKPREVYKIIERMTPGARRLELFCRGRPPSGWRAWGLEAVPLPGPGRPRRFHFDHDEAARLRASGASWAEVLVALHLPTAAKSSVRRACAKSPFARGPNSPGPDLAQGGSQ